MSTPVDVALVAVSEMSEEQPVSMSSPSPVVDRSLVAQLVADARGKGLSGVPRCFRTVDVIRFIPGMEEVGYVRKASQVLA